jgi:drug/metabolite transporter (DMT)-like permease
VHWLLAAVGVLGVSASGPLMAGLTVPALAIAFWRNALATAVLVPVAGLTARPDLARVTAREAALVVLAGVALAAHFATWIASLKLTSVASATALVCLQAAWVVLLSRMRGEAVGRMVVAGLGVAFAGVLVVSGVDLALSRDAVTGDVLALAGGFFGALYTLLRSALRRSLSTTTYTTLCYATCASVLLAACLLGGHALSGYAPGDWAGLVAVTVAAQLLGHSVFNHLLATMSPTTVSLVVLLEVPGAAALAAVLLGQAPPVAVYLGVALIVLGLALVVSARRRERGPVEAPLD